MSTRIYVALDTPDLERARDMIHPDQAVFLDRLIALLQES